MGSSCEGPWPPGGRRRYNTHQIWPWRTRQPTTRRSRRKQEASTLNRLLRSLAVLLILTAPALYAAEPVTETIHVVITGGANAGTYDGTTDRGGCSAGSAGKGSGGNQY